MAHLKVHGFVQIRNRNRSTHTRTSQWKEAFIETVQRRQKVSLVVSFKMEERRRIFQLCDNIAGVEVRCCGQGMHLLHLTLKNNTSLLIDQLSFEDVQQLKSFLDSLHLRGSRQPTEAESNADVYGGCDPCCGMHQEPACGYLGTPQGSGAPLSLQVPVSVTNAGSGRVERERVKRQRCKKRKLMPSSSSGAEANEDVLKGNNSSQRKTPGEAQPPLDTHSKQLNWQVDGGFPNLGNTCYMNSVLQSIFGIPTFAADLLMQDIPLKEISDEDLLKPFCQLLLLKDHNCLEAKRELLKNVKKSISTVADTFLGNEQNDAHEFLSQCLNQLKLSMERLNAIYTIRRQNEMERFSRPPMFAEIVTVKRFVCPVVTNFEMELRKSITCEGCGEATVKTEVSNYLSVDLHQGTEENPLTIQKSFDLFFRPEKIEHNCERCKNKSSVLRYTLRRLPRVLIVHLKRYHLTSDQLLVKDQNPVVISYHINVSSQCDQHTKPPPPFGRIAPRRGCEVPNVSRAVPPEVLSRSTAAEKVASEPSGSKVLRVGSKEGAADLQKSQSVGEDAGEAQRQRGQEGASNLEPELVRARNRAPRDEGEGCFPAICESVPVGIQDPGRTEMGLQEVPENPEFNKYEKVHVYTKSHRHPKEQKVLEGSQEGAQQLQQNYGSRVNKELLQRAPPPSVSSTQEDTGQDPSRSSELRAQKKDPNPFAASGSDNSPGDNRLEERDNTDAVTDESKYVEMNYDPQNYRLVSVVSHVGSSQDSGHYVSDVYNFLKHGWFAHSDVSVYGITEDEIRTDRLQTGYIFFYMHNEFFEVVSKTALGYTSKSKV